ncbi:MAG TPA: dirigent protein [Thermoanaerobaculia bacterium]|nr:dirigent protein [Thermoanaerobaculia bacterium]
MMVVADATRGTKSPVDVGPAGSSQGDLFVFDQPLVDQKGMDIGTNSGFCVSTKPGEYSECQWTLKLGDGTITVAGREAEKGTSRVSVIGGTGAYAGVRGELATTSNGNGTFTQVLTLNR